MDNGVQYYINLLNNGILTQIDIPNNFLYIPDIKNALTYGNWYMYPSMSLGWTTVRRRIFYPN
jgi:hypothetical protein